MGMNKFNGSDVTIELSGATGTGKSSLMNRVTAALREQGFTVSGAEGDRYTDRAVIHSPAENLVAASAKIAKGEPGQKLEGFKLVAAEATREQLAAGLEALRGSKGLVGIYEAMTGASTCSLSLVSYQVRSMTNRVGSKWSDWAECTAIEVAIHWPELGKFNAHGIKREIRQVYTGFDFAADESRNQGADAQPVGEVADMKYNRVQFYRATGDTTKPYLVPGTKLYTHADAGEVERLRVEVERLKNLDHRQILAESAAKYLLDSGSENFTGDVFTIEADDGKTKFEVIVTTQKVGAKSPGELCNELKAERDTLRAQLASPNFEAAARALAGCMDYPWEHMPDQGRQAMICHAKAVVDAALSATKEGQGDE